MVCRLEVIFHTHKVKVGQDGNSSSILMRINICNLALSRVRIACISNDK